MRVYKSDVYIIYSPHPNPLPRGEGAFTTASCGGGHLSVTAYQALSFKLLDEDDLPVFRRHGLHKCVWATPRANSASRCKSHA
jgi:hypothetical protein